MAVEIKETLEDLFISMRDKKIAVIGNAIFQSDLGAEIDSHDEIIRFNGYQIEGFENKVGKKITWWCVHPFWHENRYNHSIALSHRHYKEHLFPGVIIRPKRNVWQEYRDKYYKVLSSGMTILYIFDILNIKVDAYGFDHFSTGHYFNHNYKRRDMHTYENEIELKNKLKNINWRGI